MSELGNGYNRVAVISEFPRLQRAYTVWYKLLRVTRDSWPALFGTKEHKRRKVRLEKAAPRFNRFVEKEFGLEGKHWRVRDIKTLGPSILWRDESEDATV